MNVPSLFFPSLLGSPPDNPTLHRKPFSPNSSTPRGRFRVEDLFLVKWGCRFSGFLLFVTCKHFRGSLGFTYIYFQVGQFFHERLLMLWWAFQENGRWFSSATIALRWLQAKHFLPLFLFYFSYKVWDNVTCVCPDEDLPCRECVFDKMCVYCKLLECLRLF